MNQTGVRSTGSRRQARRKRSFRGAGVTLLRISRSSVTLEPSQRWPSEVVEPARTAAYGSLPMATTVRTRTRTIKAVPGWPARVGGLLAVSVSGILFVSVVLRHLVDALNLWTIILGAIGALLAMQHRPTRLGLILCEIFLIAAALPAAIGGVGFLYVPSILFVLGELLFRARSSRA
jgi:hypothetical protein